MMLIKTLLTFVAVVAAGTISNCKKECFKEAVGSIGCSSSDMNCICSSESFADTLSRCVDKSCPIDESNVAKKTASEICSNFQKELKRFAPENYGPGNFWPAWSPTTTEKTTPKETLPSTTRVAYTTSVPNGPAVTPALPFSIPDRLGNSKFTFPGFALPQPTGINTVIPYW